MGLYPIYMAGFPTLFATPLLKLRSGDPSAHGSGLKALRSEGGRDPAAGDAENEAVGTDLLAGRLGCREAAAGLGAHAPRTIEGAIPPPARQ